MTHPCSVDYFIDLRGIGQLGLSQVMVGVFVEDRGLVAGGELLRPVQRAGWGPRRVGVIEVLYRDVRREIAGHLVVPLVVEVVNVFQVLFSVHCFASSGVLQPMCKIYRKFRDCD